jgi:hypothetical protein
MILAALIGCSPEIPDSGRGVGFSDYGAYELERAQREAALRGEARAEAAMPDVGNADAGAAGGDADAAISTTELADAGIGDAAAAQPEGGPAAPATSDLAANPGISDEQDFEAVAARETIESDAERRERQAAAYEVVEPTALPQRPRNDGPNIVQFALDAPNDKGEPVYSRAGLFSESRFQRNCAKYNTPDAAQRDFLARGGPQRDRMGLDPDGDGFACGWDPTPFRNLADGN